MILLIDFAKFSLDNFDNEYKFIGLSSEFSYLGNGFSSPYTELEEAKINFLILWCFINSIKLIKPIILESV